MIVYEEEERDPYWLELKQRSEDNLQMFMKANPKAVLRNNSTPRCKYHAILRGMSNCRYNCKFRGAMIDHSQVWRIGSNTKDTFLIGEPYNIAWDWSFPGLVDDELIVKFLPQRYSWYYPGVTYLIFVAKEDIMERLNLNYTPANPKKVEKMYY